MSEHSGTTRVVLVDDHAMVRRGLAAFLKAKPDLALVGEASNGGEAITLCERLQPQVRFARNGRNKQT